MNYIFYLKCSILFLMTKCHVCIYNTISRMFIFTIYQAYQISKIKCKTNLPIEPFAKNNVNSFKQKTTSLKTFIFRKLFCTLPFYFLLCVYEYIYVSYTGLNQIGRGLYIGIQLSVKSMI